MTDSPEPPSPEPWAYVEPGMSGGDVDSNDILKGVGLVIHEWSMIEIAFGNLQAILTGNPRSGPAIRRYGLNRVFSSRMEGFKKAAEKYFVSNCNQDREAELDRLVGVAVKFSERRNEVAHGVIRTFYTYIHKIEPKDEPQETYYLVCPYYSQRRGDYYDDPDYKYNAKTLTTLAKNIAAFESELDNFADSICPDEGMLVHCKPFIGNRRRIV